MLRSLEIKNINQPGNNHATTDDYFFPAFRCFSPTIWPHLVLTRYLCFVGLHCCEGEVCQVSTTLGRPLPGEALPQGPVPDRWAPHWLTDDARTQQWQEADGDAHRQTLVWDHQPPHWRGISCLWNMIFIWLDHTTQRLAGNFSSDDVWKCAIFWWNATRYMLAYCLLSLEYVCVPVYMPCWWTNGKWIEIRHFYTIL